jgi:arabinofuranan 3-O-arabinosyltransferase
VVWRLRHVAICVALAALAFLQDPGLTVLDTKVDLTVDPVGWLNRALHLWNPASEFGQVQNQAYGYLWPMGPFFVAGFWLDLPEWVIQRLWWALVMCVAYLGVVKLSRRLAIGTPFARAVAGVAFALSPRVLTELGTISIEAWPLAVAPWVLVPLVGLREGGSIRRSVTLSALAVACIGGVNGTAALAVVPMALLWLVTLTPVRRRLVALAAWIGAVACATAWWVIPLLLLGRYSPPFLDYIETARSTTRITDLPTVARGASHWLAYFGGPYGPTLPAGNQLATDTWMIVATLMVAGLGLVGLARPGLPHRRFLVASFLVGLALVGMGHATALDGGVATFVRDFLDSVGAPLRNVHKFDVVVRLPLVLGLAHLLGALSRTADVAGQGLTPARLRSSVVSAISVVAVFAVATPATAGRLPTHGSYERIPEYWYDATAWLNARAGSGHVLVVPGARFPTYTWGRPSDEIVQALLDTPWVVRHDVSLTPPSTIRFLDSIESVLATGSGSRGLADVLARAGVNYVLLRSDLDYGRSASPRPIQVRQALLRSPGLTLAAGFGPTRGEDEGEDRTFVDSGLDVPMRSLEVFAVGRPVERVVAYGMASATTVVGGPEALIDLAAAGELTAAPTVLVGDLAPGVSPGRGVITDTLRRREVAFGLSRDNASSTMSAAERFKLEAPAHDYLPAWAESYQTVARYRGIESVTAASSWADVEPLIGSRPEHLPFAAIDGDAKTSWRTAPDVSVPGQWLEIGFAEPRVVDQVRLRFDVGADFLPTEVTVRAGAVNRTVEVTGGDATVSLPDGRAITRLRVVIREATRLRIGLGGVGITEIELPDLTPRRTLALPRPPSMTAASVLLTAAPTVPACYFSGSRTRCVPELARRSEDGDDIDRTVVLPASGFYRPAVWARPRPGPELDQLLDREVAAATPLGLLPDVSASSGGTVDPAARPGVVLDGDPSTAWSPASGDRNPWIRLNWVAPRVVSGLRLTLAEGVAATPVGTVTVVGDDGIRTGEVDENGFLTFDPPMRTDEISVVFPERPPLVSFNPYRNTRDLLPVAVGELTALPDPPNATTPLDTPVELPCGSGPTLELDGSQVHTALQATVRDLHELREVPAVPCGDPAVEPVTLATGERILVASASTLATATRVLLTAGAERSEPVASPVEVAEWSATRRRVTVKAATDDQILAVRENVNPGWHASVDGRTLTPIVVDGWQQGWVVPAGLGGEIVLEFPADTAYRAGMLVGAGTLLLVLVLAFVPARRRGAHAVTDPGQPGSRSAWTLPALVGGVALLVVGGAAGAVLLVPAGLTLMAMWARPLDARARRLQRALRWWVPVGAFALAGWLSLAAGDDRASPWPQLAALVSATALWLSAVLPARRAGQRAPQV